MEYLLKQFSTQVGDPIPEKVKEWFGNDEALFKYLKPSNYKPELWPLLKQRGETPAQFYWRMVKAAYTARLGGEEHLDSRVSHFYTFFELSLVLLTTHAHGL